MSPILFYGVPMGCSFGSIVALEWLAIPYRLCRIAMPETVQSDAFRRINPLAETPALATADKRIVCESMAILNHLAPQGIAKSFAFEQGSADFDRLNQMLGFLNTTFFDAFSPLWHVYEHELSDAEAAVLRNYGHAKVTQAHGRLEALLSEAPFLLGRNRSLADAYFIGVARWAEYHNLFEKHAFPRLAALKRKLLEDPAVRFAQAIEAGETATSSAGYEGSIELAEALEELGVNAS